MHPTPDTRVVVTGLGLVTSIGTGRETFWQSLLAGTCGLRPVVSFDTAAYPVHLGGEVEGFDPEPYCLGSDPGEIGRASQLGIAAARLALEDAALELSAIPPQEIGVAMGTTSGEPLEVEAYNDLVVGERLAELGPGFLERYPSHLIAVNVALEIGCEGMVAMLPTACAAGSYAIAHGYDALRFGRAEVVLAGGADAFSRITYTGFARLGAIAPERCQPFDRNRQGMVPGEGAAVLVLETLANARRRGARVWAEVLGYGLSCDAHHMTAADPAGAARAMTQALATTGVSPGAVSYISAHGTGTPTNDRLETEAVKRAFGAAASAVPMSSIKSMLGHTMGAASAIEAAVCCLAVAEDVVPPTIGFETPDPECDLDCVPNVARELPVDLAMNNAYAFGGNNASMLFGKAP